jgi:hypothetical protein
VILKWDRLTDAGEFDPLYLHLDSQERRDHTPVALVGRRLGH